MGVRGREFRGSTISMIRSLRAVVNDEDHRMTCSGYVTSRAGSLPTAERGLFHITGGSSSCMLHHMSCMSCNSLNLFVIRVAAEYVTTLEFFLQHDVLQKLHGNRTHIA